MRNRQTRSINLQREFRELWERVNGSAQKPVVTIRNLQSHVVRYHDRSVDDATAYQVVYQFMNRINSFYDGDPRRRCAAIPYRAEGENGHIHIAGLWKINPRGSAGKALLVEYRRHNSERIGQLIKRHNIYVENDELRGLITSGEKTTLSLPETTSKPRELSK